MCKCKQCKEELGSPYSGLYSEDLCKKCFFEKYEICSHCDVIIEKEKEKYHKTTSGFVICDPCMNE